MHLSLILVLFCSSIMLSQEVNKLRAESVAIKFQNDDGTWKEWTDWKESDVLAVLDDANKRVTLYTEPKEVYDIINMEEETTEDGNNIFRMMCVDGSGVECNLRLQYGESNNLQLYIQYSNIIIAYNVHFLD